MLISLCITLLLHLFHLNFVQTFVFDPVARFEILKYFSRIENGGCQSNKNAASAYIPKIS